MKKIRKSIHTETISCGKAILRIIRQCYPADNIVKMSLQNLEKLNTISLFNPFNCHKHIFYKTLSLLYCDYVPMTRGIRQEIFSVKENSPAKKIKTKMHQLYKHSNISWSIMKATL